MTNPIHSIGYYIIIAFSLCLFPEQGSACTCIQYQSHKDLTRYCNSELIFIAKLHSEIPPELKEQMGSIPPKTMLVLEILKGNIKSSSDYIQLEGHIPCCADTIKPNVSYLIYANQPKDPNLDYYFVRSYVAHDLERIAPNEIEFIRQSKSKQCYKAIEYNGVVKIDNTEKCLTKSGKIVDPDNEYRCSMQYGLK